MCGKASVYIKWKDVYTWATSLTPPAELPPDPEARINVSPSRLRRKSEPDSMVWETLPVIRTLEGVDRPQEAIWPYLPHWSNGRLPYLKSGKLLSTANARLKLDDPPFAPTYMSAWKRDWLHGSRDEALALLRPYPDEQMGVEDAPMEIKIPGNQNIQFQLPGELLRGGDNKSL